MSFFTTYVKDLDDKLSDFVKIEYKVIHVSTIDPIDQLEISKTLTTTAIALCCSTYEQAVYAMFEHYCNKNGISGGLTHYFSQENNRHIPSANWGHLTEFIGKFGKDLKSEFVQSVKPQELQRLQSLYTNRNSLAHKSGYQMLTVTLADVLVLHKSNKALFRKLETRIRKAMCL